MIIIILVLITAMIIITGLHTIVTYVSYTRYATLRTKYLVPIHEDDMRLPNDMPVDNPFRQPFLENLAMLAVMIVANVIIFAAANEFPDIRIRGFFPL